MPTKPKMTGSAALRKKRKNMPASPSTGVREQRGAGASQSRRMLPDQVRAQNAQDRLNSYQGDNSTRGMGKVGTRSGGGQTGRRFDTARNRGANRNANVRRSPRRPENPLRPR